MAKKILYPVKKLVFLTDDMAAQITDFRFEGRIKSESEAVRRLIKLGLAATRQAAPAESSSIGKYGHDVDC